MTFSILWNFTVCFSKLSVLLMYTALIPHASMQKWARGIGATVILWNLSNIIAAFLICRPVVSTSFKSNRGEGYILTMG
jgi:hypothetical protein